MWLVFFSLSASFSSDCTCVSFFSFILRLLLSLSFYVLKKTHFNTDASNQQYRRISYWVNGQRMMSGNPQGTAPWNQILFRSRDRVLEGLLNDGVPDSCRRRVLVLYVNGTIGMRVTKTGAFKPCKTSLKRVVEEMAMLPEIPFFDIRQNYELVDSSNMSCRDYLRIAEDIERYYDDYNGFFFLGGVGGVLHGTDTMHYSASALSFLLTNISKPALLTGSVVSVDASHSDGRQNPVMSLILSSSHAI